MRRREFITLLGGACGCQAAGSSDEPQFQARVGRFLPEARSIENGCCAEGAFLGKIKLDPRKLTARSGYGLLTPENPPTVPRHATPGG